jgi:hypothetical protein
MSTAPQQLIPTQTLIQTQKQIQALFLRPVRLQERHKVPEWLDVWYRRYAGSPDSSLPEAFRWGTKYFQGAATSWPALPVKQEAVVDVFLKVAPHPPDTFSQFVRELFPGVPLRFVVTGPFRALTNTIGAEIHIHNRPGHAPNPIGTLGLFLKDRGGSNYALTCYHVLSEQLANPPQTVDIAKSPAATLSIHVPLIAGEYVNPQAPDPEPPNQVDCALAKLNSTGQINSISGFPGATVKSINPVPSGTQVTILNDANVQGQILSTQADLCISYDGSLGTLYFDDLLAITGATVQPGDSGSLVIPRTSSPDKSAAGQVVAMSSDATTLDGQDLGPIVIACDMQKILDNLSGQHLGTGGDFTLL